MRNSCYRARVNIQQTTTTQAVLGRRVPSFPRSIKSVGIIVLTALLAFSMTGCGDKKSDSASLGNVACVQASIDGAGSSFAANIVQQWVSGYQSACKGATVNYKSNGSGAGIQNLTEGTVDFAGSDVPLTDKEQAALSAKYTNAIAVPWSAGGIAIEYKLSGVSALQLTPEVLADIFMGKITKWNDTRIAEINAGSNLPGSGIQVVHRSDSSGTTAAFTEFLKTAAPSQWTVGSGKDVPWPVGQGAKGSEGVTALVKSTEGAIGYAELSYAKSSSLSVAKIRNKAGKFVGADSDNGVTVALEDAKANGRGVLTANFLPSNEKAYPISTLTYLVVGTKSPDQKQAELVKAFAEYALKTGQIEARALSYAPLPQSVVDKSIAELGKIELAAK